MIYNIRSCRAPNAKRRIVMFKVAVGHSEMVDVEDIMEELIEQCEEQLDGASPKAGIMFAAVDMEYKGLLSEIQKQWPGIKIVGCTTDGETSSQLGFVDDSVSLTLFASDTIDITVGIGRNTSRDIRKAANEAFSQAVSDTDKAPSMCVITPTSLTTSNEQIVKTVREVIGIDLPLFGASAGDQWRFQNTFQFFNSEVLEDAIPMMVFSGPMKMGSGTQSGWKTIGPIGVVTKVEGNVVFEIDEKPSLEFYRSLLGPEARPTGDRPLAILDADESISRLRASNEMYDPDTGSVTFFGEFTIGDRVQVTVASRGEVLEGTRASVVRAKNDYPSDSSPAAAMVFSCSARKLLLGTRTAEECDILKEEIGEEVPIFGFYGYGEIGPALTGDAACEFHNETFVTVLMGE
jgi:hypothetical protein